MIIRFFVMIISIGCLNGCAHVISGDILEQVNRDITFGELRKSPEAYTGKMVVLGGVIVKSVNKKDGTLLEIYQTEIEDEGMPINLDVSDGRFLAFYEGFLDSEIYRAGRKVTIAGSVRGKLIKKLGQVDYHYPYLIIKEMHLWAEEKWYRYEPYPYPLYPWRFWDPWWRYPWHPFYGPYRGSPYYPFY
jgi:outer membrane lipoprotein